MNDKQHRHVNCSTYVLERFWFFLAECKETSSWDSKWQSGLIELLEHGTIEHGWCGWGRGSHDR